MSGTQPIIAIVGLSGVGKSEVTRLVQERYGCEVVYFGGQVTSEVARRGMPSGPESEREVREELRGKHGMEAIARLAEPELREKLDAGKNVVIDGIYSYAELIYLRDKIDTPIKVIAVHSARAQRYERMAKRPVRPLTKEQLDDRDMREIEALDKATPITLADYHLVNDGSLEALEAALESAMTRALAS